LARDFSGTSQSLNNATPPTIAGEHTLSCWADGDDWVDALNASGVSGIFGKALWSGDTNGHTRFETGSGSGGQVKFKIRHSGGDSEAAAASFSDGSGWHHLGGRLQGTTIALFKDGSSAATASIGGSTFSNTTSADISIGAFPNNLTNTEFDGRIAECAIWDEALSDAHIAALAKGVSPLAFPRGLVFYAPLLGRHDPEIEIIGRLDMTVTGATQAAHPRVFYPAHPFVGLAFPRAAITGTAGDGATEVQIVAGGQTIIITLTNDTWVASGGAFDAIRQDIIDGLDSAQAEATGWNNEVRDNLATTTVVRTSDTVVTITLSAQAAYNITAPETITVTVPGSALVGGNPLTATPTFNVTPSGGMAPLLFVNRTLRVWPARR